MRRPLIFLTLLVVIGCSGVVIDPGPDAFSAGDLTLIHSVCEGVPGRGLDSCLVTEGTDISSTWNIVVPAGKTVVGGEVDVYYRDLTKAYNVDSSLVQIPWADFFGAKTWSKDHDGEVMALLTIRWKDDTGVINTTFYRGLAKIIVTAPGYTRLPIDSGLAEWGTTCTVSYSTSGRSSLRCQ